MPNSQLDREIFRLSIPNIISNVSVPLLSSVDTALMGYLSIKHLGAVGLGAMIFNLFYWNFGFLRMGTTGMTAQAFGARDNQAISTTLMRALLVAIVIASIFCIFQSPIFSVTARWMSVSGDLVDLVYTYFSIRIWDAPATLALYALMGWFFGMQNARLPLLITIIINVINIGLSYFFIMHLDLGIRGVAMGTVMAQYSGLALAIVLIWVHYRDQFKKIIWKTVLEAKAFRGFLTVNRDIFIRTVCLTFAFAFFYSRSSDYGEVILAVNVVLLQFLNWMSYGIDGFAFAAESIVGKYKGAGDRETLRKSIGRIFFWALVLAVFFALLYGLGGSKLFTIFTRDSIVIQEGLTYLPWMIVLPLLGFASYIWDGVFVGLTAAKSMRNSMIVSLALYLAAFFTLRDVLGPHVLWVALSLFLMARGVIQTWQYRIFGDTLK